MKELNIVSGTKTIEIKRSRGAVDPKIAMGFVGVIVLFAPVMTLPVILGYSALGAVTMVLFIALLVSLFTYGSAQIYLQNISRSLGSHKLILPAESNKYLLMKFFLLPFHEQYFNLGEKNMVRSVLVCSPKSIRIEQEILSPPTDTWDKAFKQACITHKNVLRETVSSSAKEVVAPVTLPVIAEVPEPVKKSLSIGAVACPCPTCA